MPASVTFYKFITITLCFSFFYRFVISFQILVFYTLPMACVSIVKQIALNNPKCKYSTIKVSYSKFTYPDLTEQDIMYIFQIQQSSNL